ncbi:hypothetical protein ACFYNO_04685 [Kitasatospora sp. NPDC006697]|uniref:hypothetical protein n=1 Tax=Kitasatospora sp. NPDC006697 TaxID=3364020 RepID=UPI0036C18774
MGMKTLRVDGEWVGRVIGLADGRWDQGELERAFLAHGWAEADESGDVVVGWGGGACAPHFFGSGSGFGCGSGSGSGSGEGEGEGDGDGEALGWRFELGDRPVDGGPEGSFVQLPCALFWPPFGAEPEDGDEDDLDEDYSAAWARRPDAGRDEFRAEYERLGGLVRALLGEPVEVVEEELDCCQEVWERNGLQVVLQRSDDVNSYSYYDVINLRVGPAVVW